MADDIENAENQEKAEKRAKRVGIILHFDAWDEDGNRLPAAPVLGLKEGGTQIRKEVTHVSRDLAEKLVDCGKASVPLK